MNKFIFTICVVVIGIFIGRGVVATESIDVYFFFGEGCPHCEKADRYLLQLAQQYDDVRLHTYEVWYNAENRQLLHTVGQLLGKQISGVPFIVVGTKTFAGYYSDDVTGAEIVTAVQTCRVTACADPIASVTGSPTINTNQNPQQQSPTKHEEVPATESISLPFFGSIQTKNFSLPLLTIIIAALDGFNPCAMWTLIFLIGLLVGMQDRRRMWVLGGAFIGTSALVYFFFLAAWLNLLQFLGAMVWVRTIIGVIALGGGAYYLKEFFSNRDASCKVTRQEQRRRILDRLRQYAQARSFWLALGGIILLAMAVNLVELVCSAGLPAVYTQVLALSDLPQWQYYTYLLLYIFIFLLDDLFVFFVAMKTLQVTGLTSKYARASHLIGGVVMLIIGLLLIFKPEVLMFG